MADGEWVHSLTCAWYTEQASSTRAINRMPRKLSRDLCGGGIRFSGAITHLTRLTYLQVYLSEKNQIYINLNKDHSNLQKFIRN